jgi:CRISPR system Cascade subunit CasB
MPSNLTPDQYHFMKYLTGLNHEDHRQELAVLRRGLSAPPAEDPNMFRIIARFVPDEDRNTQREKVYYLVAALYAFHPQQTENGNFGAHMALAAHTANDSSATERRFTVLLNAPSADLPDYLRQAVSFLKSKEIPINWFSLFEDLLRWDDPNKSTQHKWANGFWAFQSSDAPENNSSK